jgi:hypothetical protein
MDHRFLAGDAARDFALDRIAVRPVVFGDHLLPLRARQSAANLGMQLTVPDGPVEVDQEPRGSRCEQRRAEGAGHLLAQLECTWIPTTVAVEKCLAAGKQPGISLGHSRPPCSQLKIRQHPCTAATSGI